MKKNELIESKRLTDGNDNYFFGYYDVLAWSRDEKYHLCHSVDFCNRLPSFDDVAKISMIDTKTKKHIDLTQTTAWNFQQGAMLQWNPKAPNEEIIFNSRSYNGDYNGVILNVHTKEKRFLDMPVATVSPKGDYALSINFNRMFNYRPGYGYDGVEDKFKNENSPKEDGIFLIDMATGKSKLIISLEQIWEVTKKGLNSSDRKVLVNHIAFNTDGSRFMFLPRCFPKPEDKGELVTAIVTSNTDGSEICVLRDYSLVSHYNWMDIDNLLIYTQGIQDKKLQLRLLKDNSRIDTVIDSDFFKLDGHCSYSPDRKWILYDSYPDIDNYRNLYLYNLEKNKGLTIGSYFSNPDIKGDYRCDLHPRWAPSGTKISFDSTHEGSRHIYTMDLKEIINNF